MAEKIDELQLGISSDAQSAIDELGRLSTALDNAATSAKSLSMQASGVNSFATGLKNLSNVNTDNLKAVSRRLKSLSKIDLSNLDNKRVDLGMSVDGGDQAVANLTNASKALRALSKSGGARVNVGGNILGEGFRAGLRGAADGIKTVQKYALSLGKSGTSALGSFMNKLGLIPGHTKNVNNMALSFGNLLRAILPFYGIRGIFDWLKESVGLGSSIVEIQNVIDTAFGSLNKNYSDISGRTYQWATTTKEAFGVSELSALRYAGRLQSIFNSSGFDVSEEMRNSASKMTTDLIERAGDIASFYDISVDEAMTKMQSGLVGMSRPLRSLGINLSVANMEAYAMSQGINVSWKELDQASQMALRYSYILEASQYAAGDFQRTQMSLANQLRILSVSFQELSASIGQGLVSAITPVVGWLNILISKLLQAANAFRLFMWTLFGKPLSAARGIADDLLGSLDDSTDAVDDLGSGASGASDGLGSAGKAAKELKKQLTVLPFDELNQLAKDTSSAGSGGSGGGGGGGGVGGLGGLSLLPDYAEEIDNSDLPEAVNRWAARMREAFEKHQWKNLGRIIAEGINAGFQYIYDALDWNKWKPIIVDGFITPSQDTFNSMMRWIDWDLIGRTFARGLNDVVYTLRAWITGFEWREYGTYIATGLNSMLSGWDADAFGRLIADKFKAAWDWFGGWVSTFDFSLFGTKLKEMVRGGIDELDPKDMGNSFAEFLNGLSDTIISFLEDKTVRDDVANAFSEFVSSFIESFDEEDAAYAISLLKTTFTGIIGKALGQIDKSKLAYQVSTVISSLPWGAIGLAIGAKAGVSLATGIFGAVFKAKAIKLISGMSFGGGGTAGATGTASAVGGGAIATAAIDTLPFLALMKGIHEIGSAMRKFSDEHGGVKQGANLNTDRSFGTTPTAPKATNGAGYSTQIQTQPITQTASVTKATQIVETIMTGIKDPSFLNLENAKASLMDNPIVKKIMDGITSKSFNTAFSKFTDTNPYQAIKKFGASVTKHMETWYGNLKDTKPYQAIKKFGADPSSLMKTWWTRFTDTKPYQAIKKYGADPSSMLKTWWTRFTDTKSYQAIKKFGADPSALLKTWWGHFVDTGHYLASKWFTATDKGNFTKYTDMWKNLKDKWVDINVSIVKKTSDLGAWIKGKWEELVKFDWFAKGGLFQSTSLIGVGEAGAEAVLPLTNRRTMKMIGNAISDAGGTGFSSNSELAREIAREIAPIVMSAVVSQTERPIDVNAVLYTENNEVLARAVNRGNRSLDKRYRPVSQYSY